MSAIFSFSKLIIRTTNDNLDFYFMVNNQLQCGIIDENNHDARVRWWTTNYEWPYNAFLHPTPFAAENSNPLK